ncbi:MAG: ATP-binding SpoIIE family protein phosphatase [Cystobacter sp.]
MEVSTTAIAVTESSQAGHARRTAAALAAKLGFTEEAQGRVALVASEAAKNLVAHAREGQVLLRALSSGSQLGVEILAVDKGPGMADVDRCMRDGYTTAGTGGSGLGAMKRMSSVFDIYSQPGVGTVMLAQVWRDRFVPAELDVGVVCVPMAGEEVCGDSWALDSRAGRHLVLVTDGLGHGPDAARASRTAVTSFLEQSTTEVTAVLKGAHEEMRGTRGAAVALASLSEQEARLDFAGVGNIAAAVLSPSGVQRMVSMNGTLGHQLHRVQSFPYTWGPDSVLVMCSDGLLTQWRVDTSPGLLSRHPSLIAGVLYRDFNRGRDDVTVLVARAASRSAP